MTWPQIYSIYCILSTVWSRENNKPKSTRQPVVGSARIIEDVIRWYNFIWALISLFLFFISYKIFIEVCSCNKLDGPLLPKFGLSNFLDIQDLLIENKLGHFTTVKVYPLFRVAVKSAYSFWYIINDEDVSFGFHIIRISQVQELNLSFLYVNVTLY